MRVMQREVAVAATLALSGVVCAYNVPNPPTTPTTRRSVLAGLLTAAAVTGSSSSSSASITEDESVYFGVGCFWHIQHEFVAAEQELLGRKDNELSSLTGYAGGKAVGSEGRVCYHNIMSVADYGKLGHAEVVGMKLPTDKIVDFSKIYFSLFDPKTGGASHDFVVGSMGAWVQR